MLGGPAKSGIVAWLAEDQPESPKTEPFDPKKCRPEPRLRADTFTHHAGDLRGVVWEQHAPGRGPSECLWMLVIDEHDDAYRRGCDLAAKGELYPKDPPEPDDRLEDADEHDFAEVFASAATALLARGHPAALEVEKGGYWAKLELLPSPPKDMWLVTFRRTKDTKEPRRPRWLSDGEICEMLGLLFEDLEMELPDVEWNCLVFPIYGGRPRTARRWLHEVARLTVGI